MCTTCGTHGTCTYVAFLHAVYYPVTCVLLHVQYFYIRMWLSQNMCAREFTTLHVHRLHVAIERHFSITFQHLLCLVRIELIKSILTMRFLELSFVFFFFFSANMSEESDIFDEPVVQDDYDALSLHSKPRRQRKTTAGARKIQHAWNDEEINRLIASVEQHRGL